VTIYYCPDDRALAVSRYGINFDSRIGALGFWSLVHPPMENIDSIRANTSIVGHDYFATGNLLLLDLRLLLRENRRAAQRGATLRPSKGYHAGRYWDYWSFH
jgi:hypothetical protein